MRTLVRITHDSTKPMQQAYTVQPDSLKAKLISTGTNKTKWLCGLCTAYAYGTSLYVVIDSECTAHGHVVKEEVSK